MKISRLFTLILCLFGATMAMAQELPSVSPTALYTTAEGEEVDEVDGSQSAPLKAHFAANPADLGDYTARYEWKIFESGKENEPLVHRFEEEMDYTFTHSGSFMVQLYATFVLAGDTIQYPEEGEANPFVISISESKLEFPNAFSPNGDGYNDVYRAKDGYQSIVSFQATIFNRWGQKLYQWNSPDGGWDGRFNGRTVKDGVYFVNVNAKGADGRVYHIRKDVNVITGYRNDSTGGTEGGE